ncbi:MAG: TetR/AcrR family transcriptional regulator [Anaerolineae bacterium]|nr:TetR/AcrR family transcriptional regulator [Anaerolineae bacterium]
MTNQTYHHGDLKNALITAGLAVLSETGIEGLSLRKVAQRAGVSHTAPYNHFADKQALLAAISTAAQQQMFEMLTIAINHHRTSPDFLYEIAWETYQFAQEDPGRYRLMFSHTVEEEFDYPEFIATWQKNIMLLEEIVRICQECGQFADHDVKMMALHIWSTVHGFILLALERQLPPAYLEKYTIREMLMGVIRLLGCNELK